MQTEKRFCHAEKIESLNRKHKIAIHKGKVGKAIRYHILEMSESPKSNSLKSRLSNSSFTNLFHMNKKRKRDEDNSSDNDFNSPGRGRKVKMSRSRKNRDADLQEEEKKFQVREKKYDSELPEELRKYRPKGYRFNIPPKDRPLRVYADGVFDLFHLGHMKQLEQCKKALPNVKLICGIPSDRITHKLKGLTVLTDEQRCETLKHCKWVDEVIPNAPWVINPEFLKEHNIDYVAHDDIPYGSAGSDDIYRPVKETGKFLVTQRTNGISTSDIITKIIRDYDQYLMRNFARGATKEELNISWLKKNELDFKKHINDFRSYFKKNQVHLNNASKDLYFEVREILLRKTLGNKLYSKLVGGALDENLKKTLERGKRLIREKSPASDFASEFTGETTNVSSMSTPSSPSTSNSSTTGEEESQSINRDENSDDNDDNDNENSPVPEENGTSSDDGDDDQHGAKDK